VYSSTSVVFTIMFSWPQISWCNGNLMTVPSGWFNPKNKSDYGMGLVWSIVKVAFGSVTLEIDTQGNSVALRLHAVSLHRV